MLLGRTASQMVALTLVLFALERYGSPALAGLVSFFGIAPGLLASPIAGALLDRYGRAQLVILDYLVASASLALVAALAALDRLPLPLLLAIVAVTSLTQPLSNTGMRTLFPLIVPRPLWERANAIDSNGYMVAGVLGPALAGVLVAALRGEGALATAATIYALAVIAARGIQDPSARGEVRASLIADARAGLMYVARHPTLRGLAFVVSTVNVAQGLLFLALPVLLLGELRQGPALVGQLFALAGAAGFMSALAFGRVPSAGRERQLFIISLAGWAAALVAALLASDALALALAMLVLGVATGPFDVVLFTLRQRRTDPAWLGRAFAVSMALNYAGFPLGSALGGGLAAASPRVAIGAALALTVVAALLTFVAIPDEE